MSDSNSSGLFITVFPTWKTKKSYVLIKIKPRHFKLCERDYTKIKKCVQNLLEWFLYINPESFNSDLQKIIIRIYNNKKSFKKKWGKIDAQTFKLYERNNTTLKGIIESLLEWLLYIDPFKYKSDLQEIIDYNCNNKKDFKNKWNLILERY